jgi:hypothetical protein
MKKIKETFGSLKEKGEDVKDQVREKILGYILAALGLVAGLSWNETMKAFIEYLFPLNKNSLLAKFIYSIFVTILIVLLSLYLTKLFSKKSEE